MSRAVEFAEIWRGGMLECVHRGHAVVCDGTGAVVEAWGDPGAVIFPRSACKMIQALPLVESGLALTDSQLALSCASHAGASVHTDMVAAWIADMGLGEADLRCGAHMPRDTEAHHRLIRRGQEPCQLHNNCSGKHAGFLALNRHLGGGAEYVEPDHPVQKAVRAAFEEVTGEASPGFGIDGCSAPNFATTLAGLARGMAFFANAHKAQGIRAQSAVRLRDAMAQHPVLVSGDGRASTELMRAMGGRGAVKSGAEGVFVAILPDQGLGIALKVEDGASRASECAIAALLVRYGALAADHPAVRDFMTPDIRNCRGLLTGLMRPAAGISAAG